MEDRVMENEKENVQMESQRKQKKGLTLVLLLLLVVFISVGYAALSSSLNINGTSTIENPTWDVVIDDSDPDAIDCPSGETCTINPSNPESLTPDDGTGENPKGAIIWMDGNTVYFKHVLAKPGDKFEFTTKFSNNGTIDAKLDTVTKSELNATAQRFLTYDVTYADGTTIKSGDALAAGATATFKVTVTYKSTVTTLPTAEELALINETSQGHTGATSLFTVSYVQA